MSDPMSGIPLEQLTATADRLRVEADLTELIGKVLSDAVSFPDAGAQLASVANAKRAAAEHLDEMVQEGS